MASTALTVDLPRRTIFDKVIFFLSGGYPHIHAITATASFYLAHILLYVICIQRELDMPYQPLIVSELALEPTATAIYQTILLITLLSGYTVINQRYFQVHRFLPGSRLNRIAYILGVYCQFHMPLIFMYPLNVWPLLHQVVAFEFFVIMTIYVALNACLTHLMVKRNPDLIPNSHIFIPMKIALVVLSAILTIIQISLLGYKKSSDYATEWALPKWKWLNVTASVFEWLHIMSLILGVCMFSYEMKPHQLRPTTNTSEMAIENA